MVGLIYEALESRAILPGKKSGMLLLKKQKQTGQK